MAAGGCMAAARGAAFTATSPLAGYLAATAGDRCCGEPLLPLRLRCVSSSSSSSSPSSSPMTGIPHACGCATRSRVPNAVFAVLGADRQKHAGNVRSGLRHLEDTLRTLRAHTASRRGLHEPCRLLQRYGVEEGAERRRRIRGTTISASSSDRPDTDEAKAQAPNPAPVKTNLGTSSAAQLLGMKGAKAGETVRKLPYRKGVRVNALWRYIIGSHK
ncbi:hypothetical protein CBR_g38409 [Chara braunii]|uniref:Uncharacterized protein n=1 Tax=Chara braunii TaxID=69332 RepID=A0A388JNQ4_CHABU|nr:hypothetical protein CBR_g38409 [Chara braunii]|eukprot:GBG59383.1 hypothetical protein CBR_g38409 [Chara braunii]